MNQVNTVSDINIHYPNYLMEITELLQQLQEEIHYKGNPEIIHHSINILLKQYSIESYETQNYIIQTLEHIAENSNQRYNIFYYLKQFLQKHQKHFQAIGHIESLEILLSSISLIRLLPGLNYNIDINLIISIANQHGINLKYQLGYQKYHQYFDSLCQIEYVPARAAIYSNNLLEIQGVLKFEKDCFWRRQLYIKLIDYFYQQRQNNQCKHYDILAKGIDFGRQFMNELIKTQASNYQAETQAIENTWKQINLMLNENKHTKIIDILYQQAKGLGLKIVDKEENI